MRWYCSPTCCVAELDLIFHHDKVHFILDEIIMGGTAMLLSCPREPQSAPAGMVLETNINEIINANEAMNDREVMVYG